MRNTGWPPNRGTWSGIRPVADHAPHDMQGCTQQMVQLVDACLEIVVEA